MEKNLQDFLKKWSAELLNDIRVLPDRAVAKINKVMKRVRLGYLSGIPPKVRTFIRDYVNGLRKIALVLL